MSPRSRIDAAGQPNSRSSSAACALAPASSPATKIVCVPSTSAGSTITRAVTVFSVLTTRTSGSARWICSASESSLQTVSVGGIPCEVSSGLATSMSTLPASCSAPAMCSASSDAAPAVALTTISPKPAASANVPSLAGPPMSSHQATAAALPAVREPSRTSWPLLSSALASVLPTMPVPRTAIRMRRTLLGRGAFFRLGSGGPLRSLLGGRLLLGGRAAGGLGLGLGSGGLAHRLGRLCVVGAVHAQVRAVVRIEEVQLRAVEPELRVGPLGDLGLRAQPRDDLPGAAAGASATPASAASSASSSELTSPPLMAK